MGLISETLTSSLRLDGAERGGGKALSAISRSGCKTWKESRVKKCEFIASAGKPVIRSDEC